MSNWRPDAQWSADAFEEIIWPEIKDHIGGGRLLSLEDGDDLVARYFDIRAGFDAIQECADGRVRGIAQRCQQKPENLKRERDYPYNTFTIRNKRESGMTTENEKRRLALEEDGGLYPAITVQAYLETKTGPWMTIGFAKTRELYKWKDDPANARNIRMGEVTSNGAASFVIVPWWALGSEIVQVIRNPVIYPPKTEVTKDPVLNRQQLDLF